MSVASRFSELPKDARLIWAKSDEVGPGHCLLGHLLDVAAVAETILELEPNASTEWAAANLGLPLEYCTRWLAACAGLHDFGKAIPGFQAKWPEGMGADQAAGLSFPVQASLVTDHSCATAALLGRALHPIAGSAQEWLRAMIQAISAHHGYHFLSAEINKAKPLFEPPEWGQARQVILNAYWQVLSPQESPTLEAMALPAVNWLAGLTSTADWIASNPEWFPLGERVDDLPAYYSHAKELARQALNHIGWRPHSTLLTKHMNADLLMANITAKPGLTARPLQIAGDALLASARGPALMLVEAPMGEGKTELAFMAHLRLQAINQHRGLYLALPTQATGNAMFKRALTFLEQFVDEHADVQLVHGGASMNEDVQHLRGINQSREESLSASAWFSQRKRPLLSPYGVGTVDQALFSALNVKHHFVRLWGLANRVVVLDEVHAYDTYTSGLIAALLRWLKAMGSSVVLMSATLPKAKRDELIRAWGLDSMTVPNQSYPRVLVADDSGLRAATFEARPLAPIQLASVGEQVEDLALQAEVLLAAGGCGAIIVNTVDRAQQLYRRLRAGLPPDVPMVLFHARFPADERLVHEQRVLQFFGPDGERPQRALMVATQVAEQSLDIDFDFMLSDLAPIDLLLQRAGRLHRHQRVRQDEHRQARLWVAGLSPADPKELRQVFKKTAWSFVYDAYILGRTWALLQQEPVLKLPEDIDRLVQSVYGDTPLPDGLEQAAQDFIEIESYGEYRARVNKERQESFNVAIDPEGEPAVAYNGKPRGNEEGDGLGLENRTRLGRASVTLIPVEVVDQGWKIGDIVFQSDQLLDDETARRLYQRQLKVSKAAVVRHFQAMEVPRAFAEHALLRNCHPLPLTSLQYDLGLLMLRLDPCLGLIEEKRGSDSAPSASLLP